MYSQTSSKTALYKDHLFIKTTLYRSPSGLGRLHVKCNRLRLRLPLGSVITITIMITQFSKVIEYDYDYMTKVIDYNYDYNETGLRLIICKNIINFNIIFF